MKKLLFTTLFWLGGLTGAMAADNRVYQYPVSTGNSISETQPAPVVQNKTQRPKRFYAGGRLGYGYTSIEPKDLSTAVGGAMVGVKVGDFRFETDVTYMAKTELTHNVNYEQFTFLLNAYYDLPLGKFKPFVGVGAGTAYSIATQKYKRNGWTHEERWDDTNWAVAAMGGASYDITPYLTAEAMFRYIYVDLHEDAYNLQAIGGVRYNF